MNEEIVTTPVEATELTTADVSLDDSDELLIQKLNLRLSDAKSRHTEKVTEAKKNMQVFLGKLDEIDSDRTIKKYKSKATVNRVFLTIRNMVGMATDRPASAFVTPSKNTVKSKKRATKVEMGLQDGMDRTEYQDKLALTLFSTWIKSDAYQHWFWNYTLNDFDVVNVLLEDLIISTEATDIQTAEYLFYTPNKNRAWWKKTYPKFYDQIKFEKLATDDSEGKFTSMGLSQRLIQYWENDLTVSMAKGKTGDIILEKKKNPYFEYRTEEEQLNSWLKEAKPEAVAQAEMAGVPPVSVLSEEEVKSFKPITNFFTEAKKPFIQIPSIRLEGQLYSVSLINQLMDVFLSMNKKKRQIDDNLRGCNIKWVLDSSSFSKEEKAKVTDAPNQVIEADFTVNPKPLYCVQSTGFEIDKIMLDIQHDEKYIDDIFGHHEISRGAGKSNTLGQDQMNFESDKTPIRQQVRNVESAIKQLWGGWIQLMKMYYVDKHYINRFGAKSGLEMVELMNDEIEDGINPILKPASTIPVSKAERANEAMALWAQKAIDPYTLFLELDKIDPEDRSNRLINWLNFMTISDEDPNKLMADMQNHANSPGDSTDNPIERADMENTAAQEGKDIPPTPPEYVTPEHVKLHYAFIKDVTKEMEQEDYDMLMAHVEVDKATLGRKISAGMLNQVAEGQQPNQNQQKVLPK